MNIYDVSNLINKVLKENKPDTTEDLMGFIRQEALKLNTEELKIHSKGLVSDEGIYSFNVDNNKAVYQAFLVENTRVNSSNNLESDPVVVMTPQVDGNGAVISSFDIYLKEAPTTPEKPITPEEPKTPETPKPETPEVPTTPEVPKEEVPEENGFLPQLGEKGKQSIAVVGLTLLGLSGVLLFIKKRKTKHEKD